MTVKLDFPTFCGRSKKSASWTVTRALTIREASHGYGRVHTEVVELGKRQRLSVAEAARRLDAHAKLSRQ